MPLETRDIKGVEIFSVGTWNGDEYTQNDLEDMVRNFSELRSGVKPYLKLGHDDHQRLIQSDGLPAAGWVDKLYIVGDKLLADFCQVPKTIYELISAGAYKKVSSEIFFGLKIGEKIYSKVLAAVSLLGADTPAVMNLKDILAFYTASVRDLSVEKKVSYDFKNVNYKERSMQEKTEVEIQLENDLKAKDEQIETIKKEFATEKEKFAVDAKELAELRTFKAKAEAEKQELLAKAEAAEKEQFISGLISEKLCSPAMKDQVSQLYTKENKDCLKEVIKFAKELSTVNFDENSANSKETTDDFAAQDKKIKEYMTEHKVTYSAAVKALNKQKKA